MTDRKCDVYKITCLANDKLYIGVSYDAKERWRGHVKLAKHPESDDCSLIHQAINKYGKKSFKFEVMETHASRKEALLREIYWIAFYKCNAARYGHEAGYNLTDGGEGLDGNCTISEATKRKLSEANKGRPTVIAGKKKVADDEGNILYVLPEEAHLYAHNETPHPNRGKHRVVTEDGSVIHVMPEEVHLYDGYGSITSSTAGRKAVIDADGNVRHVPPEEAHLYKAWDPSYRTENQILGIAKRKGNTMVLDKNGNIRYVPPNEAHIYEQYGKPSRFTEEEQAQRAATKAEKRAKPSSVRGKVRVLNAERLVIYVPKEQAHLYEVYGKPPPPGSNTGGKRKHKPPPRMAPEERAKRKKAAIAIAVAALAAKRQTQKFVTDPSATDGSKIWVALDDPRCLAYIEQQRLKRNTKAREKARQQPRRR